MSMNECLLLIGKIVEQFYSKESTAKAITGDLKSCRKYDEI